MKKFMKEFKTFISRGNVMDMAVGTIIGAAFSTIVTALSNGILKPLINTAIYYLIPGDGLNSMYTFLVTKYTEGVDDLGNAITEIDLANSIYIDWGAFISAIINFLLIALVLFCIIKAFNNLKDAENGVKDMDKRIANKEAKNIPLTKKEKKYKAVQEQKAAEAAAAAKAAEEAAANAPKEPTTNELLGEIVKLLEERK